MLFKLCPEPSSLSVQDLSLFRLREFALSYIRITTLIASKVVSLQVSSLCLGALFHWDPMLFVLLPLLPAFSLYLSNLPTPHHTHTLPPLTYGCCCLPLRTGSLKVGVSSHAFTACTRDLAHLWYGLWLHMGHEPRTFCV